jgi:hypothetical protein
MKSEASMKNETVFLFPIYSAPGRDAFDVVDIADGRWLGVVGILLPAREGYDAFYGWESATEDRSTDPYHKQHYFRSASDAADSLAEFVASY